MSGNEQLLMSPPQSGELRAVADLVPALISFYSPDHICRFANAYHRDWCAKEPSGYLGLHMSECIGEELYAAHKPFLARLALGEEVAFEAVVPHRDGGTCRSIIKYLPKFGAAGFEGFFIVVTFPDESEHAHEELKKTEYRYRNMFRAMAVSFLECDFTDVGAALRKLREEGVNDLRRHFAEHPEFIRYLIRLTTIIDANDKAVALLGARAKGELFGSTDCYWPAHSEHVFAKSVLAAVGRVPYFQEETRLLTLRGEEVDVLFTVSFAPEAVGKGVILIGLVDITERNRAQNELQQALADLAHAARVSTLGELTASIAHEVNQPLAAIVSNGAASLRWLDRESPDLSEARTAIGRMIEDGKRASDIIARTRMMLSNAAPDKVEVDVNSVISDAVLFLRHETQDKRIALQIDLADNLPPVLADKVQLHQVMVNLVVNAVQAIDGLGDGPRHISIRSRVDIVGWIWVEVSDSGPGIAKADAEKLFKAFFTTKKTGMGMGLSICNSIIEAHGGRIWATPNKGQGTTFSFTLPRAEHA